MSSKADTAGHACHSRGAGKQGPASPGVRRPFVTRVSGSLSLAAWIGEPLPRHRQEWAQLAVPGTREGPDRQAFWDGDGSRDAKAKKSQCGGEEEGCHLRKHCLGGLDVDWRVWTGKSRYWLLSLRCLIFPSQHVPQACCAAFLADIPHCDGSYTIHLSRHSPRSLLSMQQNSLSRNVTNPEPTMLDHAPPDANHVTSPAAI